ncbi:hypothetical protein, partial [Streptomyces sp.]|uniref:hypothetical protein n=1 Tax=Streptomyces sp. TaxID=1931 RepID=UPI002810C76F
DRRRGGARWSDPARKPEERGHRVARHHTAAPYARRARPRAAPAPGPEMSYAKGRWAWTRLQSIGQVLRPRRPQVHPARIRSAEGAVVDPPARRVAAST